MRWTRNSRFWLVAPFVVLLSAVMSWRFDDISAFTQITLVFMAGASAKSTMSTIKKDEPREPS